MKNTLSSYKLIYLWSIFNSICVAIFLQLSLCTLCTTVPMNQHKYCFHLQQFDFWKEHKISYHKVGWYLGFFFLKKSFKGETSRKYTSLKFAGPVAQICVLFLHLLINICTEGKKDKLKIYFDGPTPTLCSLPSPNFKSLHKKWQ